MGKALSYDDLRALGIAISKSHIARMEAAGTFPVHFRITDRKFAWDEGQVMEWLDMRRAGFWLRTDANGQWIPHDEIPVAGATVRLQPVPATDRVKPATKLPKPPRRALAASGNIDDRAVSDLSLAEEFFRKVPAGVGRVSKSLAAIIERNYRKDAPRVIPVATAPVPRRRLPTVTATPLARRALPRS